MAGTEKFRVATLDVETISETLAVRDSNIEIMEKFGLVRIRGETLRWWLCEASPPPHFIKTVWLDKWYFICEKCRDDDPRLEGYSNINSDGEPSTASEDEASSDSELVYNVFDFRNK